MDKKFIKKGFTLIELLVVISIIGILAALVTVSFSSAQKQARDTKRKSDLRQYQNSLELSANKHDGFYISYPAGVTMDTFCSGLEMSTCAQDPKYSTDPSYTYHYLSDGTGNFTASQYVLWSKLENVTNMFWVVCSTGQTGKITSSTSFSGGTCPGGLTQ